MALEAPVVWRHTSHNTRQVTSPCAPRRHFNGLALKVLHMTMDESVQIEDMDYDEMKYRYSVVDGSYFDHDMTVKISYKVTVEADPNGGPGSVATMKVKHYWKHFAGLDLTDEQVLEQTDTQGCDVFYHAERDLEKIL